MPTYQYVDKTGNITSMDAPDETTALRSSGSSGVRLMPTPNTGNSSGTYPPPRNDTVGSGIGSGNTNTNDTFHDPQRSGESTTQYRARVSQSNFLAEDPNSATGFRTQGGEGQGRAVPTIDQAQAQEIVKGFGIAGFGVDKKLGNNQYTAEQARALAESKKKELLGAAFANKGPSNIFEVTQLNNIKKASDRLVTGLNTSRNDPWKTDAEKKQLQDAELEKVTTLYANEYKDPNEFINSYKNNPNLQGVLANYIKAGGSVDAISQKIQANSTGEANTGNIQSVTDYLLNADNLGLSKSGNALAADKYLNSERQNVIENTSRLSNIPKEYSDFYFGTPERIGTFEKTMKNAKITIDNLTKAFESSGKSTVEQFDYEINKNKLEGAAKNAELETKRLKAKTNLTERLSSLGLLNTSSQAAASLESLDVQYEQAKATSNAAYTAEVNNMVSKKTEAVNKLETALQEKLATISSDLDKTESQIEKDVFDESKKSEKEIASLITSYNSKAKSTYNNFLNTSNKAAQLYIKEFLKTAGGGLTTSFAPIKTAKGAKPTGVNKQFTSGGLTYTPADLGKAQTHLDSIRGVDGYIDPAEYKKALDIWTGGKGLQKDFINKFPVKNFINPKNNAVPHYLDTGGKKKKTQTEGNA